MSFYALWGHDVPAGPEIRKATRPAHLAWLETLGARYKLGSPLFADDGATPIGSLVIIEASDLAHARATFAEDPYEKAGLWRHVDIRQLNGWNPR